MDTTAAADRFELPASARAVLRALATDGPATRPQLSTALALSRPTMSVAMAELSRLGLVAGQGSSRGATGRSAVLCSLAPTAGHVLGVEIGATVVRAAAYTLDGQEICAAEVRLPSDQPTVTPEAADAAAGVVRTVREEVGARYGPLREVVVAAPTLPNVGASGAGRGGGGLQPDGTVRITDALAVPDGVPVTVENNVNCAAVAEHRLVAAVVALLDPGLVVLGGGVGQNQLVLLEVRRTVHELTWPTDITIGGLADRATLLGAVHVALTRALDSMTQVY
ncbi:hypothetical protein [Streptomyces sp. NPDC008139]|uniref:hypothetical protein n=1 Tax=Streptomyces sp. NPDC008139 TaxID=3364814 RepID=UPI0036EE147E